VTVTSQLQAVERQDEKAMSDQPKAPFKILIIDDNRGGADILANLLRIRGHEVQAVYSGWDALESAERFQPECIVSDIGMPGMDGYDVAKRFRSHESFKQIPLIALTASTDTDKARMSGFDHHLVKPVDSGVIARLIKDIEDSRYVA
jgi:CheY-like chemotaxis protein